MRVLACLALGAAIAAADWSEAQRRFRAAYHRKDASADERRKAILDLAGEDIPDAAEALVKLFTGLGREKQRLRRELFALRDTIRDLRRELAALPVSDTRQRDRIHRKIEGLEESEAPRDRRLAGVEMDQAAVLEGLRSMESPAVLDWLARVGLERARSAALLQAIAQRIATARESRIPALLAALERLRDPGRIVPLLQALGAKSGETPEGVTVLLKHLRHSDWAVRVAAAYALARAARPEGVGPIVEAIQSEKPRSRARNEMARALAILTGERIGPFPDLWARWWRDHAAEVNAGRIELGKGRPEAGSDEQGRFYGIPQDADRIIYVFDRSGSMEVSMENPRWVGKDPVPARDDEESRFEAAVRELLRATKRLRRGSAYAVILYADHAQKLHDELVPATPDEHVRLGNALARTGPSGSTNIYEALDLALRMANVHSQATRGETRADAIFLVSDGSPTNSKGEAEDPERTLQAVREWNAQKRVAIHTIGIGRKHNAAFLGALAAENGGRYYSVEPSAGGR